MGKSSGPQFPQTYGVAQTDEQYLLQPGGAVPVASATVDGPDAYGDAASAGTAATFSKGNHKHGLPAAPAPAGAFVSLDATDAAAPANPSAGYARIYSKAGRIYSRDSGGVEYGPFDVGGVGLPSQRLTGVSDAPGVLDLGAYGDEFEYSTHAAAAAVWTPHTGLADFTILGSALGLRFAAAFGGMTKDITVPTNCEIAVLLSGFCGWGGMFGPGFVDGSGNGPLAVFYQGTTYVWDIGSGYSGLGSNGGSSGAWPAEAGDGRPYWIALKKAGTVYTMRYSTDGVTWTTTASRTTSVVPTKLFVGSMQNNPTGIMLVHRFVYGAPTLPV
jgi:hypothetical protein